MEQKFANSGGLFARQKKSEKSPDFGGDITLGQDLIDYLNQCLQSGQEPKLEVSAWRRMGRGNTTFMSLKVQIPYEVRSGSGQNDQNRSYQKPNQFGGRQESFTQRARSNSSYEQASGRSPKPFDDDIPF